MGWSEKGRIDRSGRAFDWRHGMKPGSEGLLREALELPAVERAALVDRFLTSLNVPDAATDKSWRKETAAGLRAYRAGTAATVSSEDILAECRAR
jgi:putative addiction module component (TIGR02574 family)